MAPLGMRIVVLDDVAEVPDIASSNHWIPFSDDAAVRRGMAGGAHHLWAAPSMPVLLGSFQGFPMPASP